MENEENFTNLKVEGKTVTEAKKGEYSATVTITMEGKMVDGKQYLKMDTKVDGSKELTDLMNETSATIEMYYEETADATYIYMKDANDKWTKNELTTSNTNQDVEDVLGLAFKYAEDYDMYEYSADAKGYVFKSEVAEEEDVDVTLKFKDGKLCGVLMGMSFEDDGVSMDINMDLVITYGGQSVTLPPVA